MIVVAKKVLAEQFLDKGTVRVVWRVAVSKLTWNALMDLNHGQEAHFSAT